MWPLATVTKQEATKIRALTSWIEQHCCQRQYCFQVRKCGDTSCCPAPRLSREMLEWLPDPTLNPRTDHYLPLEEVIGTETTDCARPGMALLPKVQKQA